MALLAEGISALVAIKIKARHDGFADQYNRIFMVKICVLCSAFIGFNYFNDKVSCIIANSNGMGGGFVGSVCWIQGFYIYEEMKDRLQESGYYGIPRNMDYDGINPLGQLCTTTDRALDPVSEHLCTPMTKVFYLQYQYMPFFVAALSLLFYFPYIIYKTVNMDFFSLKDTMSEDDINPDKVVKGFFDEAINKSRRMRYKSFYNICVKVLYILANCFGIMACDAMLNNDFHGYGINFMQWLKYKNSLMHAHDLRTRVIPKPGNILLPPMGFCDVHEASRDVRNTHINKHKFICEISPHVLYQYVLIVFWFLLIIGIVISILGLVGHLLAIVANFFNINKNDSTGKVYKKITMRERDYLEYIRQKNSKIYVEVLRHLQETRLAKHSEEKENLWNEKD